MDFVGKVVKKEFKEFGVFEGVVESYDPSTGFFKILYEDGDSEEADLSEVVRLSAFSVTDSEKEKVNVKRVGRKPKRRSKNSRDLGKGSKIEGELGFNVANGDLGLGLGLDLNRGTGLDDGEKRDETRGVIDLNLSVENDEFDQGVEKGGKKERGFDLNLGFDDENIDGLNLNLPNGDGFACRSSFDSVVVANHVNCSLTCEVKLEEGSSDLVDSSACKDGNTGHRKRRRVSKNLNSPVETVLRRSARRAKAAALNENDTSKTMVTDEVNDLTVSGVTDESEEQLNSMNLERVEETLLLPPKIELPPSSTKLNLDGVPVMDIFSVYSCLRSFSTLLYLSPFELEDFVEALKSKVSNLLIDFIHVSILQTLRKHLEFLANEGVESALTCLRNMNWDLLDVVTWPVFMVEYLLIHGSGLKPGFALEHLSLFDGEYYKQPAVVRLELLRCLCDDVIEVDAIRLELGKRMIMADAAGEIDRRMIKGLYRKSRVSLDDHGETYLGEDVMEVADGNSDECCLCKMDGNLICCDGCPAAYHSKCVGIVSSLLPDGEWYCPECVTGRPNFGAGPQKLIRGAELLGNDLFGRLYFSCFDYLLVSDSCDAEASCSYYHKDDLTAVIQLLKLYDNFNGSILNAISQHWAIPTVLHKPKIDLEAGNCMLVNGKHDGGKRRSSIIPGYSSYLSADTVEYNMGTQNRKASSEGSAEVLQANQSKLESEICCQVASTKSISSSRKRKKNNSVARRQISFSKGNEEDALQNLAGDGYINCYSFARTASSIVEELLRKPSDKANVDIPTTEEQIIAIQLKFMLKKSSKFSWMTVQNLNAERQKENCGWCYCCRFPVEGRDCLFNFTNRGPLAEGFRAEVDAVLTKKNKKGHLVDIICYILCMEERLRGLLVGPWLSPHYSELWRKTVLKASDVSSLKRPLLMLEANLRPLALSADWWKHVDSVKTMGSSIHYIAKTRVTSKNGVSKRKGRYADSETKSLIAAGGLGLLWWRGGKTSRGLFNWKVVPRPLALKAARKAGCIKIPGIQYPDGSENAKRNTCLTWRAFVETSRCLEQLALQVRELDLFVRWDDIENAHPHSILDKESLKSIRLFKKAIIRRKCIEGTHVKYLLDFGKRRCIPDVVIKHGLKVDESSDEKKKYWLEESYVPLHLLKTFEERRITRKAGKASSSKVRKGSRVIKKPLRRKGFDYLFSRAERADSYQCGHCNKNVLISKAVSCELCKGFFHKRHVMKSSDTVAAGCTYICHRCRARKCVKTNSGGKKRKFGKLQGVKKMKVDIRGRSKVATSKPSKKRQVVNNCQPVLLRNDKKMQDHLSQRNDNVYAGMTLRRSARKAKSIPLQSNSYTGAKKRKSYKSRDVASKETPKDSFGRKRRTQVLHSFWLKGLLLSRKPNDERVIQFKRRKLLVPSDFSDGIDDPPKCTLCPEQGFISTATYIGCETCRGWFHGDAFGLDKGHIECVIGFKCHVCLDKSPPVCPFIDVSGGTGVPFTEATTMTGIREVEGLPEIVVHKETDCLHELHSNEISPGFVEVQTVQSPDENLDHHDKMLILDSEMSVENGPSKEAEVQAIERHNEILVVHKETGCAHEFHSDEISTGPVEVQTVQYSDGNLGHDQTLILDSEMNVENGSPSSEEAEAQATKSRNVFPEVLIVHKETDCVREFQTDENYPGFMEAGAVQSSDGDLDHGKTGILDSEMSVEDGSPSRKEAEAQAIERQNEDLKDYVREFRSDENSPCFMEAGRVQNSDGDLDHDKTLLDFEIVVENGSPSSKEAEAQAIKRQNDDLKDCVPEFHSDENSPRFMEAGIVQNSDGDLDHDKTRILDSQMSFENGSLSSKEAEAQAIESQNGDLKADLPKVPGESSTSEENRSISIESKLMLLDETESQ